MAKVYVSSTFLDLQDYREQVEKVIRRMGHTDVAMEYYVAEDQRPVDRCFSDVKECDLYIGIFAWRYGWIPTKKNKKKISITEMEYRQAQKSKKPCLIFLLDGRAAWPPDFIDDDKTQIKKLRNELSESHGTGPGFKSLEELRSLVTEAIHKWEKEQGLIHATTSIPEYDLNTYYEALRKRYNVLALEGLTPPQKEEYLQIQLRSVFVEQNVREDTPPVELPKEIREKLLREQEIHKEDLPSGITLDDLRKARESYYRKPSQLVLDALTNKSNKYAIILGDPGSGKSTLSRYVMLSLIDPLLDDEKVQKAFDGYLPLLVELRAFVGACVDNKCETPLEYLEYLGKTEGWGLTQVALHNHLKNDGRAVVIFDGLDEIFEPQMRETITKQIVGFTNAYPKARVIVTSRILGYRRKILSDAGFKHYTLQDLDEKQVETFITKWYELAMSDRPDEARERSDRILKSFQDSSSIRQLAGNPMLLTIMAIIGKHQELPRERWKLYDHAASVLIQHWDVNKHLKDERIEADFIGEDDKKELLRRLAYRMQGGDGGLAGNYIHREGLQEEFESYLKERYSQKPDRAKLIAEAMIQQFRERNFILSLYGANLYGFVHRAFLEYFCAFAFVWKFEKTKELTIESLKNDAFGKHWDDQSWREVLRLISGMINEKWVYEISTYLEDLQSEKNEEKVLDLKSGLGTEIPLNRVLSIECLGEIRHTQIVTHLITKYFTDADSLAYVFFVLGFRIREYLNAEKMLKKFALNHSDNLFRGYCVIILIQNFRNDIQTLSFLRKRVVQDENTDVRSVAVLALAEYYREDARTLPLLRERTVDDDDWQVRRAAVDALAEYYREDTETLPLLRERTVDDDDWQVRRAAVDVLAEYYREDTETLPLLRERAVQDQEADVRSAAVRALAEYYREDTETLPLLRERAVQDESPKPEDKKHPFDYYVRQIIINAIAEYWRDNPDTLSLLRDRAENDPTPWLRERCQELIEKIEGKKE